MAVNFLFTFAMGQAFLSMLCGMQWGIFLLFACFCVLMTAFVWIFLPGAQGWDALTLAPYLPVCCSCLPYHPMHYFPKDTCSARALQSLLDETSALPPDVLCLQVKRLNLIR